MAGAPAAPPALQAPLVRSVGTLWLMSLLAAAHVSVVGATGLRPPPAGVGSAGAAAATTVSSLERILQQAATSTPGCIPPERALPWDTVMQLQREQMQLQEQASRDAPAVRQEAGEQQPVPTTRLRRLRQAAQAAGAGSPANASAPLRVALVNDVEFHHEVTLGWMWALQHYQERLAVYVHPKLLAGDLGWKAFVQQTMPAQQLKDAYYKPGIEQVQPASGVHCSEAG
jgi:hypothetical protein